MQAQYAIPRASFHDAILSFIHSRMHILWRLLPHYRKELNDPMNNFTEKPKPSSPQEQSLPFIRRIMDTVNNLHQAAVILAVVIGLMTGTSIYSIAQQPEVQSVLTDMLQLPNGLIGLLFGASPSSDPGDTGGNPGIFDLSPGPGSEEANIPTTCPAEDYAYIDESLSSERNTEILQGAIKIAISCEDESALAYVPRLLDQDIIDSKDVHLATLRLMLSFDTIDPKVVPAVIETFQSGKTRAIRALSAYLLFISGDMEAVLSGWEGEESLYALTLSKVRNGASWEERIAAMLLLYAIDDEAALSDLSRYGLTLKSEQERKTAQALVDNTGLWTELQTTFTLILRDPDADIYAGDAPELALLCSTPLLASIPCETG